MDNSLNGQNQNQASQPMAGQNAYNMQYAPNSQMNQQGMGQIGTPNQMGGYPAQQYPYQNPQMAKPLKQPMDPVKKKKLVIGFSVGGVALALGIAALIIVPILLRIDYSSAYSAIKELKPMVYDIYHSYDCGYVVDNVNSTYTEPKTYNEYIERCKEAYDSSINDSIAKLENTDGVKRNSEINTQFAKFKSEYTALQAGDPDTLASKLALWQARHNFVYAADDLSYSSSSDSEFTTAANYLIDSGNDALKTYGEDWLEKSLAIAAAYRAYRAASWQTSSQLYNDYNNKKKEKDDWVAANKPDINAIAPLNFNDTSKMYSEFTKLYDLIATTYQENYNSGSGDCNEFLGEVYCK